MRHAQWAGVPWRMRSMLANTWQCNIVLLAQRLHTVQAGEFRQEHQQGKSEAVERFQFLPPSLLISNIFIYFTLFCLFMPIFGCGHRARGIRWGWSFAAWIFHAPSRPIWGVVHIMGTIKGGRLTREYYRGKPSITSLSS